MHFTNAVLLATVASAKTLRVDVGKNGLVYTPNDIKASVGDEVSFFFHPMNHTVSQSNFKQPCSPLADGFFSGFVPTKPEDAGLSSFTITVKDEKPIWFYCGQADHCKKGMVGAINAPATGNTLAAFVDLAKATNGTTNLPHGPVGGKLDIKKAGTTSVVSAMPTGKPDCYTTTYKTTYTSNGVVCTTDVTTTVPITKPTSKPTTPVTVNGGARLGAGALAAAVAAIAML
ncbi:hypothetical protein NLG97_g7267 [Lecanicillium saksenae]|uniref:Uncharacterized protein n=1 Tax=Lecanicillium saksenae TaxID=468837 RepID=A0ACC1QNZ1_9HYPO|nr:hypothetical protein NLG97_g7267 [Lecanicillium saksenae]